MNDDLQIGSSEVVRACATRRPGSSTARTAREVPPKATHAAQQVVRSLCPKAAATAATSLSPRCECFIRCNWQQRKQQRKQRKQQRKQRKQQRKQRKQQRKQAMAI